MAEEIKIRINDYKKVEEQLLQLGARFREEISVVDTYFNQPAGRVLKITDDDKGNFLVKLKARDDKFEIEEYKRIDDVENVKRGLREKLGVKCVLRKKRRFFNFEDVVININLIEGLGEFLIVEGDHLTPRVIMEKLKIRTPEFVTVSFDELWIQGQEG